MRIGMIVKYPPIQGGVSARGHLLADGLARIGHEVTVITNAADVDSEYRIFDYAGDVRSTMLLASDPGVRQPVVRVVNPPGRLVAHIPASPVSATRLAGAALEECRSRSWDVVFSNYLEPYAVAGTLVAGWTGVPHVTKMAGSDRFRLMKHPDLSSAYKQVLLSAASIVGADHQLVTALGLPAKQCAEVIPAIVPRELFHGQIEAFDLTELISRARAAGFDVVSPLDPNTDDLIVGYYGKVSPAKAIDELLQAIKRLRARSLPVRLVGLVGAGDQQRLRERVEELGLSDSVWLLPFVPYAMVARFIKACDVMAVLENKFAVKQHLPMKLRECVAVGTPVLASAEIVRKESLIEPTQASHGVHVVEDPTDVRSLTEVLAEACRYAMRKPVDLRGNPQVTTSVADWVRRYSDVFTAVERGVRGSRRPVTHRVAGEIYNMLTSAVPIVAEVLGSAGQSAFGQYTASKTDDSPPPVVAVGFMTYVKEQWDELCPGVPRWIGGYLDALVWATFDSAHSQGLQYFAVPGPSADEGNDGEFPLRTNHVRLLGPPPSAETANVQQHLRGLKNLGGQTRQTLLGDVANGWLLFHRLPNLESKIHHASTVTARFLMQADGSRTLADIAAHVDCDPVSARKLAERLEREWLIRVLTTPYRGPVASCRNS